MKDKETGRIVGAVVAGKNIKANKGVVMATGGFEDDPVMMRGYLGLMNGHPCGGHGNTGDGHRICMKAGADFWHMNAYNGSWLEPCNFQKNRFSHDFIWGDNIKRYGITVAENGRRFYSDFDGLRSNWEENYLSDLATSYGSRYGYMNYGGEWKWLPMPSTTTWFIFDADNLSKAYDAEYTGSDDPVADGWMYSADTIEGLADQMGVPAEELVKTVDFWNEMCEKGHDYAFYRPDDTMTPIVTAPFYAQPCVATFLNTQGGPVRNEKSQVLDPTGEIIEGLYAVGEFGSIFNFYYQSTGNLGECLVSGRAAARTILAE